MEAPERIDEAQLLSYARVSDADRLRGIPRYIVSHGGPLPGPDVVVIARDPDAGLLLMYCDSNFLTILDVPVGSVSAAKSSAEEDYPSVRGAWKDVAALPESG